MRTGSCSCRGRSVRTRTCTPAGASGNGGVGEPCGWQPSTNGASHRKFNAVRVCFMPAPDVSESLRRTPHWYWRAVWPSTKKAAPTWRDGYYGRKKEKQLVATDRIECNPHVLLGKPVIRGTRISVELVLRDLSEGATFEDILDSYPHLKREDILACLAYGAACSAEDV